MKEAVEAHTFIRRKITQMRAINKAMLQALENDTGGEQWEAEAEPVQQEEATSPMREPSLTWEKMRLEELRAQMRRNWPERPWTTRKPWRKF